MKKVRLVSGCNQDGISKLDSASQLAETITFTRDSKKHAQNKVNQKELPQSKKYFSSFAKIEPNSEQKVFETKKTKTVKAEVI